MDDKLSTFLEENLIYSTKDIISNYVKTKEYKMAKLRWFFSDKEEYVDYICVSHDYADNEYLCNEETIIQFIDYLKFNKSKWKSYHIDNKTEVNLTPIDPSELLILIHGADNVLMLEEDIEAEIEEAFVKEYIQDKNTRVEINPNSSSSRDVWIQTTRKKLLNKPTKGEREVCNLLDYCNIPYERELPFVIHHKPHGGNSLKEGIYYADIFLKDSKVIVEIDGSSHYHWKARMKDDKKWYAFARAGYNIVRLNTYKVDNHNYVLKKLSRHLPLDFPAYMYLI